MSTINARLAALTAKHRPWYGHTIDRWLDWVALKFAERGAAKLERETPGIMTETYFRELDVGDKKKCPLAQVYGRYERAPWHLRRFRAFNGFYPGFLCDSPRLNRAWPKIIARYQP